MLIFHRNFQATCTVGKYLRASCCDLWKMWRTLLLRAVHIWFPLHELYSSAKVFQTFCSFCRSRIVVSLVCTTPTPEWGGLTCRWTDQLEDAWIHARLLVSIILMEKNEEIPACIRERHCVDQLLLETEKCSLGRLESLQNCTMRGAKMRTLLQ